MVEQNLEQESSDSMHSVENALSSLWDKAREASLLISTLREEKRQLLLKIEEMESEMVSAKNEIMHLQSQIENLQSNAAIKNVAINLEEGEKRLLQQKLRNVISKLDQYLTP
ncbi:MAG: hypothetical protein WDA22_06570 [Bacteroidota bacterium]